MTDAEKIARMVEFLGADYINTHCEHGHERWNPFERIEDAFLLLTKLRPIDRYFIFRKLQDIVGAEKVSYYARAIAEAAHSVIERLTPAPAGGNVEVNPLRRNSCH